jgi:hypothetical protein
VRGPSRDTHKFGVERPQEKLDFPYNLHKID